MRRSAYLIVSSSVYDSIGWSLAANFLCCACAYSSPKCNPTDLVAVANDFLVVLHKKVANSRSHFASCCGLEMVKLGLNLGRLQS